MNDPIPIDDLIADDLLLDRLAGRLPVGDEPVAAMLCAVAAHADRPLTGRARRRRAHGRRFFAAFAIIAVGASGAGVAAAVTLPHYLPGAAERARVERVMDANAASDRPSALLTRLGMPAAAEAARGGARGLVLVRRTDGQIVLVPAAAVARPGEVTGAAAGLVDRGNPAGLTGTPQVPGGLGADTDEADGNAYAYGHDKGAAPGSGGPTVGTGSGSTGSTGAAGGQPGTDGDKPAASGKKPVSGNNGKTGKGQDKVKTTAVTPPTTTEPTTVPTPATSPTESQALVAPGSSQVGTTSRKPARSTQSESPAPSEVSRGANGSDSSAETSPSRTSSQPATAAQPARTAQTGRPAPVSPATATGKAKAKESAGSATSDEVHEATETSEPPASSVSSDARDKRPVGGSTVGAAVAASLANVEGGAPSGKAAGQAAGQSAAAAGRP